jgi:hypothetical protein
MPRRRALLIGFGVPTLGLLLGLLVAFAADSVWAGVIVAWVIVFALMLSAVRRRNQRS